MTECLSQSTIDDYAAYLESLSISHYFTLTAARRLSRDGLQEKFQQWNNQLATRYRRPYGWFRSEENSYSGLGRAAIPLHYHGLLIQAPGLDTVHAERVWKELCGDARIVPYQSGGGAIEYCLKYALESGNYDLGGHHKAFNTTPGT